MSRPHPTRHRLLALCRLLPILLLPLLLSLPARAGSATAESIWDRNDARQRALQRVPKGSMVTDTQCEEISVGNGDSRYRCTVFYGDTPAQAPPSAAQPDPANRRP